MQTVPSYEFEWDADKSRETFERRHMCFRCIAEMWKGHTPFEYEEDAAHSTGEEKRFRTIIPFNESSEMFVAFTIREDRYRIISCRRQKIRNDALWETSIRRICVPFCGDASDSGDTSQAHAREEIETNSNR